jgi:hypothetical protein
MAKSASAMWSVECFETVFATEYVTAKQAIALAQPTQ